MLTDLLNLLTEAAKTGAITWDQATAATTCLKLEGDEAMLACRLLGGGADPASLAYLRDGSVPELIGAAHRNGPGVYSLEHPERESYLVLCALSEDESQDSTVRSRLLKYHDSLNALTQLQGSQVATRAAANRAEREYTSLPYAELSLDERTVRLYASDGGHAAGVWDKADPQTITAVYGVFNGEPYVALGVAPYNPAIVDQGFDPALASKKIDPERFWIVAPTNPDGTPHALGAHVVGLAEAALDQAGIDRPQAKATA